MLEARLSKLALFKRLVEALKELVNDVNFEFSDAGMHLQAMDSSHVSLCKLVLEESYFESYRCDKTVNLGMNLTNLSKVLKCAKDDDTLTLKHGQIDDQLTLLIETANQDKIMDFNMKLMEIDEDSLGIPDQINYASKICMESSEFQKIIKDLSVLGDTCFVGCSQDGLTFKVEGEVGQANMCIRGEKLEDDDEMDQDEEEDIKEEVKSEVKSEAEKENLKNETNLDSEAGESSKLKKENVIDSDDEEEENEMEITEAQPTENKKKKKTKSVSTGQGTLINCKEPVDMPFALKYLKIFVQAASLSQRVTCCLVLDNPLVVEYPLGNKDQQCGYLRYYLAPKIDEDTQ